MAKKKKEDKNGPEDDNNSEGENLWEKLNRIAGNTIKSHGEERVTKYLSSGILGFDLALSTKMVIDLENGQRLPIIGRGIPNGKVTMIFGQYQSGKTSMAANFLAQAQNAGGEAILIDHEDGANDSLLHAVGVKPSLIHEQPDCAEETFTFLRRVITENQDTNRPVCCVVDSVPSMSSIGAKDKEYDETPQIAKVAGLFHRFFSENKVLYGRAKNLYLIFINQSRVKIGGPPRPSFMPEPDNYPCKDSLNFYSDIIIKMHRPKVKTMSDTDVAEYCIFDAEFRKNKVSNDLRHVYIPFYVHPESNVLGLDDVEACWMYLRDKQIIKKVTTRSWEVGGTNMTEEVIRKMLNTNQDMYKTFRQLVINSYLIDRGFKLDGNISEG